MAYLRGLNYIWADTENKVHLWIGDGHEDITDMSWSESRENPGAVCVKEEILDQYVVMRFAELLEHKPEQLEKLVGQVVSTNTNYGADSLKARWRSLISFVKASDGDV